MGWKKNNLLRWVVELRRRPVAGVALCAAGILIAVMTSFLDRPGPHQPNTLGRILGFEDNYPVGFSLVGIAIFIWLLGSGSLPRQKAAIYIICFFAGAMIGRLVYALATDLARSSLW
jgi:hypothetical protein